jgi:hypothetical protein
MTREEKAEALIEFCKTKRCNACECYVECNKYPYSFAYMPEVGLDACFRIVFKRDPAKKRILDACCGSRMFYFDKKNPEVLYQDNRELETTLCDGRHLLIKPDIRMDFRNMEYEDNSFKVVVFDPPHLAHAGTGSWLAKKYGILPKDWPTYLKQGFNECMRVLEPDGLLVFKWNEDQIPLKKVLEQFDRKPLLGDRRGKTRWIVFIK